MKPTILLYNLTSETMRMRIKFICIQLNCHIKTIEPSQFRVPVGMLAYGKPEDQTDYLTEEPAAFSDSMLVMAGFSEKMLDQLLALMRKQKVTAIPLKAVLTQQNAVWDSVALHDELKREHEAMHP